MEGSARVLVGIRAQGSDAAVAQPCSPETSQGPLEVAPHRLEQQGSCTSIHSVGSHLMEHDLTAKTSNTDVSSISPLAELGGRERKHVTWRNTSSLVSVLTYQQTPTNSLLSASWQSPQANLSSSPGSWEGMSPVHETPDLTSSLLEVDVPARANSHMGAFNRRGIGASADDEMTVRKSKTCDPERPRAFSSPVTEAGNEYLDECSEEFLAELTRLQEEFQVKMQSEPASCLTTVTDKEMNRAFGPEGSYLITADLPRGNMICTAQEEPFAVRNHVVMPKARQRKEGGAAGLLKELNIGVVNSKGKKPSDCYGIGQDNFCVARLRSGWEVFGIFDGHGASGHWPSNRVAKTLPFFLQSESCSTLLSEDKTEAALSLALKSCQDDLMKRSIKEKVNVQACGCTAVVLLCKPDSDVVWVANVGDSRGLLLAANGDPLEVTSDHTPVREDEVTRIRAMGGELISTPYADGKIDNRICISGTRFPGIAMTRSLGDFCVKDIGVIAEPEIFKWSIHDCKDGYIFLACDGVWDYMSERDVTDLIVKALDEDASPSKVCQRILRQAQKCWAREHKSKYCDDISCLLIPVRRPVLDVQEGSDSDDSGSVSDSDEAETKGCQACALQ